MTDVFEAVAIGYRDRSKPGDAIALRSQLPTVSEDSDRTWIHIAVEGRWEGHGMGGFEFSRDVFLQITKNFDSNPNPIPLTWGHPDDVRAAKDGAAGWIHKLEIRDDGLWAFVEFTERAASMVRAGEHRFCSVVVGFDGVDRVTGEEVGAVLYEVGLVLTPFLSELNEIRLSRRVLGAPTEVHKMSIKDLISKVLEELPDDATPETFKTVFEAEMAKQQAIGGETPAEDEPAEQVAASTPEAETVAAADVEQPEPTMPTGGLAELADMIGMTPEDLIGALMERAEDLRAWLAGGEAEPSTSAMGQLNDMAIKLQKRVTEQTTKLSSAEAEIAELKRENRLQTALAKGQITDDELEGLRELGREAPGYFAKQLSAREANPKVPTAPRYAPKGPEQTTEKISLSDLSPAERTWFDTFKALGRNDQEALREARDRVAAAH